MKLRIVGIGNDGGSNRAFTIIELFVVIATFAVLSAMLLPSLASSRSNGQSFQCMNNQRQIVLAWRMYADDNNEYLPPNDYYSGSGGPVQYYDPTRGGQFNWVGGGMDNVAGNSGATNTSFLVQSAALGKYNKDASLYHCPADTSISEQYGIPRVRSVSMNAAIGTKWNSVTLAGAARGKDPVDRTWLDGGWGTGQSLYWQTYAKLPSIVKPRPAGMFVITEEHPTSINDPAFLVSMGTPDSNGNPTSQMMIDTPASYHNRAANFAFADGHVETRRWLSVNLNNPPGGLYTPSVLADLQWIQQRTTALK